MENVKELFRLLSFVVPIAVSSFCALILIITYDKKKSHAERIMYRLLLAHYSCIFINWVYMIIHVNFPTVYTYTNAGFYLTFLLVQSFLYHFIFKITSIDEKEKFPPLYYLLPIAIFLFFVAYSTQVPFSIQQQIIESRNRSFPGYELYAHLFLARTDLRVLFTVVLTCLGIRRYYRYKKKIQYESNNEKHVPLQWIFWSLALSLGTILTHLLSFAFTGALISIALIVPTIVFLLVQLTMLCYNFVIGNYIIIKHSLPANKGTDSPKKEPASCISQEVFENYINRQKPYLNPLLKITDLMLEFQTNRTTLSAFINNTYKMNFNQYINLKRMEELERMTRNQVGSNEEMADFALKAGFPNLQSYKRFKKNIEEKYINNSTHQELT